MSSFLDVAFDVLGELQRTFGFDECGVASGYVWGRAGDAVHVHRRGDRGWRLVNADEWAELGLNLPYPRDRSNDAEPSK